MSPGLLEPGIGTPRLLAIYFISLLSGSFGALLLDPNSLTVGASGAIFGLMGAVLVVARGRGIEGLATQFGFFIVLNLVLTVSIPNISIVGHLGGLIGGALAALIMLGFERLGSARVGVAFEAATLLMLAVGAGCAAMIAAGSGQRVAVTCRAACALEEFHVSDGKPPDCRIRVSKVIVHVIGSGRLVPTTVKAHKQAALTGDTVAPFRCLRRGARGDQPMTVVPVKAEASGKLGWATAAGTCLPTKSPVRSSRLLANPPCGGS
jgi:hypothetical protein